MGWKLTLLFYTGVNNQRHWRWHYHFERGRLRVGRYCIFYFFQTCLYYCEHLRTWCSEVFYTLFKLKLKFSCVMLDRIFLRDRCAFTMHWKYVIHCDFDADQRNELLHGVCMRVKITIACMLRNEKARQWEDTQHAVILLFICTEIDFQDGSSHESAGIQVHPNLTCMSSLHRRRKNARMVFACAVLFLFLRLVADFRDLFVWEFCMYISLWQYAYATFL